MTGGVYRDPSLPTASAPLSLLLLLPSRCYLLFLFVAVVNGSFDFVVKPEFGEAASELNVTTFLGQTGRLPCTVRHLAGKRVSWIRGRDLQVLSTGRHTFSTDLRISVLPGTTKFRARKNRRSTRRDRYRRRGGSGEGCVVLTGGSISSTDSLTRGKGSVGEGASVGTDTNIVRCAGNYGSVSKGTDYGSDTSGRDYSSVGSVPDFGGVLLGFDSDSKSSDPEYSGTVTSRNNRTRTHTRKKHSRGGYPNNTTPDYDVDEWKQPSRRRSTSHFDDRHRKKMEDEQLRTHSENLLLIHATPHHHGSQSSVRRRNRREHRYSHHFYDTKKTHVAAPGVSPLYALPAVSSEAAGKSRSEYNSPIAIYPQGRVGQAPGDNNKGLQPGPNYIEGVWEPEDYTLQIKYTKQEDAGTYICQINTEPRISQVVHLNVVKMRAEIVGSSELFVKAGNPVTLACRVNHGTLMPGFILWYKNDLLVEYGRRVQVMTGKDGVSHLVLRQARPSDSANYTCSPSNGAPASLNLNVIVDERQAAMQQGNSAPQPMHSPPSCWTLTGGVLLAVTAAAATTSTTAGVGRGGSDGGRGGSSRMSNGVSVVALGGALLLWGAHSLLTLSCWCLLGTSRHLLSAVSSILFLLTHLLTSPLYFILPLLSSLTLLLSLSSCIVSSFCVHFSSSLFVVVVSPLTFFPSCFSSILFPFSPFLSPLSRKHHHHYSSV